MTASLPSRMTLPLPTSKGMGSNTVRGQTGQTQIYAGPRSRRPLPRPCRSRWRRRDRSRSCRADDAHQGDVLDSLMAAAVLAHGHARMGEGELHIDSADSTRRCGSARKLRPGEHGERGAEGDQPHAWTCRPPRPPYWPPQCPDQSDGPGNAFWQSTWSCVALGKVRVQHDDLIVLLAPSSTSASP